MRGFFIRRRSTSVSRGQPREILSRKTLLVLYLTFFALLLLYAFSDPIDSPLSQVVIYSIAQTVNFIPEITLLLHPMRKRSGLAVVSCKGGADLFGV